MPVVHGGQKSELDRSHETEHELHECGLHYGCWELNSVPLKSSQCFEALRHFSDPSALHTGDFLYFKNSILIVSDFLEIMNLLFNYIW